MDVELKSLLTQLLTKVDGLDGKIDAVDAKLSAQIAAVDGRLTAIDAKLGAQIAAVDDKVEELKRVTSANHFRVIGRIDQVASMLADHMAEPHGPPTKRAC